MLTDLKTFGKLTRRKTIDSDTFNIVSGFEGADHTSPADSKIGRRKSEAET